MEQKRYQIFLSSTFSDLEIERRKVMQTLLELDCIPSGMEFFPATDEETFSFIKTVIDVCDYYILIVAGRYGSTDDNGISYTEKEYDYAIEIGKPVLSFIRKDIENIKVNQTDQNPKLAKRLAAFRSKVENGRIVKMWDNSDQLAGQVVTTLNSAIKRYPSTGWIRGDRAASSEILSQLNTLRTENEELRKKINSKPPLEIENLATLKDKYKLYCKVQDRKNGNHYYKVVILTWGEILKVIGPSYRTPSNSSSLSELEIYIEKRDNVFDVIIERDVRVKILAQFELTGIMTAKIFNLTTGGSGVFHVLTDLGLSEYLRLVAVTKT